MFRFPSILRIGLERELEQVFMSLNPGKVLYIGVMTNTYREMIPSKKFITVDIDPKLKPDIVCDVHNLKCSDNNFDTVVALQLLEHCRDPQRALNEMRRVLKKRGKLIFSVPFLFHYHGSPNDYYRFTKDSIKDLTKYFKKVNIIPIGNKFLVLWQLASIGIFQKLFHLLNPLIAWLLRFKSDKFVLNYVVEAEK